MASSAYKDILSSGRDEAVSVNQRALVEKILARYSGEYTVYRELLQNADDATASHVEIHFRTGPDTEGKVYSELDLPDLKKQPLTSIIVRNDGFVFRDEDWARLKKIAEGNPDETKIGAFGVGTFSVFSITDSPLVTSGGKLMGFYWKDGGDQLYVKIADDPLKKLVEEKQNDIQWTSFYLDLREKEPMPDPESFVKFLGTCLGFTANIKSISVYLDSHLLSRLTKTVGTGTGIPLNKNLPYQSNSRMLQIATVTEYPVQLKAEVSNWLNAYRTKPTATETLVSNLNTVTTAATSFFASKMLSSFKFGRSKKPAPEIKEEVTPIPKQDTLAVGTAPFELIKSIVFIRVISSTLSVKPSSAFNKEMFRATKKSLPSTTSFSMIWASKDEYDASYDEKEASKKKIMSVFSGLVSSLDTPGRIFIGFPTFQTTGCASSFASRFISTVERESLDFQAKYVAEWNKELLWAGGVLCRTIYEREMAVVASKYAAIKKDIDTQKPGEVTAEEKVLEQQAVHLMRYFTFRESTPSPIVSLTTRSAFILSKKGINITVVSQLGPRSAEKVRIPNPWVKSFVRSVPMVPDSIWSEASAFLNTFGSTGLIQHMSLEDVFNDLSQHPLTVKETIDCLKWWVSLKLNENYDNRLLVQLKNNAIILHGDSVCNLSQFTSYIDPTVTPSDTILPKSTLMFEISKHFSAAELENVFELEELSLAEWFKNLASVTYTGRGASDATNITSNVQFSFRVLTILAASWTGVSSSVRKQIIEVASIIPCIPTKQGFLMPQQAYFPSVALFDDLPTVQFLKDGLQSLSKEMDKLLGDLGVRRHVELQLIFSRLLLNGSWSYLDVLKYLVSIRANLSSSEMERLKATNWLVDETQAGKASPVRVKASDLHAPTTELRGLGLAVLDWTQSSEPWNPRSGEASFLFDIGLRKYANFDKLIDIATEESGGTQTKVSTRSMAFDYLLHNFTIAGYNKIYSMKLHNKKFVPALTDKGEAIVARPSDIYANPAAACLGFNILPQKYRAESTKLAIEYDPPAGKLVESLIQNRPATVAEAARIFSYMSSQLPKLRESDLNRLRAYEIIPTGRGSDHVSHKSAFFKPSDTLPENVRGLFCTIPDFGSQATPFLVALGVKEAPSIAHITEAVIEDPSRFYQLCGSVSQYVDVLTLIAGAPLPDDLQRRLRSSPFFVGIEKVRGGHPSGGAKSGSASGQGSASGPSLADDEDDDATHSFNYRLVPCSSIVVVDDAARFRPFQFDLLACHPSEALEDLALLLGAQRVSSLVTETFVATGRARETDATVELRRRILEKAYLFLTEFRNESAHNELAAPLPWIESHLDVFEVASVVRAYSLAHPTRGTLRRSQEVSAYAQLRSTVELYVSSSQELDDYDVAAALCRFWLRHTSTNYTMMFASILATPLRMLRKRGYNVDRIINSRKAEQAAAEKAAAEEMQRLRKEAEIKEKAQKEAQAVADKERRAAEQERALAVREKTEKLSRDAEEIARRVPGVDQGAVAAFLADMVANNGGYDMGSAVETLKRAMRGGDGVNTTKNNPHETQMTRQDPRGPLETRPRPPPPYSDTSATNNSTPDSWSQMAKSFLSRSRSSMPQATPGAAGTSSTSTTDTPTKESMHTAAEQAIKMANANGRRPEHFQGEVPSEVRGVEDTYCSGGQQLDLVRQTSFEGLDFYAVRTLERSAEFIETYRAAILRFVQLIVKPCAGVYDLPLSSLRIFYDTEGGVMGFNSGGVIYLNFRYYLNWYDADVAAGRYTQALVNTHHTLAHELAHNLEQPHNAKHSFYVNVICEDRFMRLSNLIQSLT